MNIKLVNEVWGNLMEQLHRAVIFVEKLKKHKGC